MNIEFKRAVICSFFGFVTLVFLLGLVPSLAQFVYKHPETFCRRLFMSMASALITGLLFMLPAGVADLLLALAGLVIIALFFVRRAGKARPDMV